VLPVLVAALVGGAAYGALHLPWLRVEEIKIEGAETLDSVAVADLTGLRGANILVADFDGARERLAAVPQLKSVTFERSWPNGITIHLVERTPWGFWVVAGREYPIDMEGVVLLGGAPSGVSRRIVEPDSNRVLAPGDQVDPDAIAFAERIAREAPRFLGQTVRELEYRAGIGVTAVFSSGLRVTFGDDRAYDYKVAVLSRLLEQTGARAPRNVDLRFGERVTYE
jgi:cell division septal protein FtsQ